MADTQFSPDEDVVGRQTLELFAETDEFNKWLFQALSPYCNNNILEIGSGIGNISSFLIQNFAAVTLSDIRSDYFKTLHQKFDGNDNLAGICLVDLSTSKLEQDYPELLNKFDTIIASNVVEHIENDKLAIENCFKMLKPGGRVVILVPAYNWLYNPFDKELGHFRRYTKSTLSTLIQSGGFRIIGEKYFNALGMLGWWVSGSILRKKTLPANQLSFYNKIVPLARLIDKVLLRRIGLSVIVAGEKK